MPRRGGTADTTRAQCLLETAARWIVLAAAVLAPWMFSASEPWAYHLLGVMVCGAGLCWLVCMVAYPPRRLAAPGLAVALILMLAYMCFQVMPLPRAIALKAVPLTTGIKDQAIELLSKSSALGTIEADNRDLQNRTISVCPGATRRSIVIFGICLMAFLIIANTTRHWHDLRRAASVLVIFGFILAVVSVVHSFTGSRELLWFNTPGHMEYGFGTFANRNHFASHITMIMGLAIGLFFATRSNDELEREENPRSIFSAIPLASASELALLGFAAVLLAATVFLSLSRGAAVSLVAASGIAVIFSAFSRHRARTGMALAVAVFALAMVVWLGWNSVTERLGSLAHLVRNPAGDYRAMAFSDTILLFGLSPLFGTGFGAFQAVFPMVARQELQSGRWVHTHCDPAEWLGEGGLVGVAIIVLVVMFFVREVLKGIGGAKLEKKRFAVGCLVAVLAVAIHSLVDFSLRKPANGLLFAVIAGMVVSACAVRRSEVPGNEALEPEKSGGDGISVALDEPPVVPVWFRSWTAWFRILSCVALAAVAMLLVGNVERFGQALSFKRFEYMERMLHRIVDGSQKESVIHAAREDAFLSMRAAACNPEQFREVMPAYAEWLGDGKLSDKVRDAARGDMLEIAHFAVRTTPSDYLAWSWLAYSEGASGNWDAYELFSERSTQLRRGTGKPLR